MKKLTTASSQPSDAPRYLTYVSVSARPTVGDLEKLGLKSTDLILVTQSLAGLVSEWTTNVEDLSEWFSDTEQRQTRGRFQLHEAAQVLADEQPELDACELLPAMARAVRSGRLAVRNPSTGLRKEPFKDVRFTELVFVEDIDEWLSLERVSYRFPESKRKGRASALTPDQKDEVGKLLAKPGPEGADVGRSASLGVSVAQAQGSNAWFQVCWTELLQPSRPPSQGSPYWIYVVFPARPDMAEIDRLGLKDTDAIWVMTSLGGRKGGYQPAKVEFLRKEVAGIVSRQARGCYYLPECAQILADENGLDSAAMLTRLEAAFRGGELKVWSTRTRAPKASHEGLDSDDFVSPLDVDNLLARWAANYRFPLAPRSPVPERIEPLLAPGAQVQSSAELAGGYVLVHVSARPRLADITKLGLASNAKMGWTRTLAGSTLDSVNASLEVLMELVADIEQRQAKGKYHLDEAAQVLADAHGLDASELHKRMGAAFRERTLTVRSHGAEAPMKPHEDLARTKDFVFVVDVDRWLAKEGMSYRFPLANGEPEPKPHVYRQRMQENDILAALVELGFDPLAIVSEAGKKIAAYWAVKAKLGLSKEVMRHAWKRLKTHELVKTQKPNL
jgi:hypothetical protein